jgi:hypothetical protein
MEILLLPRSVQVFSRTNRGTSNIWDPSGQSEVVAALAGAFQLPDRLVNSINWPLDIESDNSDQPWPFDDDSLEVQLSVKDALSNISIDETPNGKCFLIMDQPEPIDEPEKRYALVPIEFIGNQSNQGTTPSPY